MFMRMCWQLGMCELGELQLLCVERNRTVLEAVNVCVLCASSEKVKP